MKLRFASVVALSLALTQLAAPAAFAEQTAAQFRTAAPQSFSTDDLQRFGLSADDATQVAAYQNDGYQVVLLTPEEAARYNGGMSTNHWLVVGLVVIVLIAAYNATD